MNRANVRMVQSRGRASFPLKALESLTVFGQLWRQELQGHETAQPGVFRLVHDTHPAAAQLLTNSIVGNRLADHGLYQLSAISFQPSGEGLTRWGLP